MSTEIEDLVRRLEPIIGREQAQHYLQNLNNGRFVPTLKKAVERQIKELARQYELDSQITIYPVPKRSAVYGEYLLGHCYYGNQRMNAQCGLREEDFIKHIGVFGATGSGKTTTAMRIIRQLCEKEKPFLILDPKGTWQSIVRKPWASNVKVLKLGSSYAPYFFNPFAPIPGMDEETMIGEIVEAFCTTHYLGHGAKNVLYKAIRAAQKKGQLNMRTVHQEFLNLRLRGQKMESWAVSTERALENAATGILGRSLNYAENLPFDELLDSQVIILLDELTDDSQKALFMALLLPKIYWFRKLAGIKEEFRHLLVLEEFHMISDADTTKGSSRTEFLVRTCREFSQGIMIIDQSPGDIHWTILGNLNTIISMNLTQFKDINNVAGALLLEGDKRFLSKLETGWAIFRNRRFSNPVLVKVDYEKIDKRPLSILEIINQNGGFVEQIKQDDLDAIDSITREELTEDTASMRLGILHWEMLGKVASGKFPNLRTLNEQIGISYGQSRRLRKRLLDLGLVVLDERISTRDGAETRLLITEKGLNLLKKSGWMRRLGGEWHRSAIDMLEKYYKFKGYKTRREYRGIDLFAKKGSERIAIEAESFSSGTTSEVQAVSNVISAFKYAYRVVSVVPDKESANRLRNALRRSPLKQFDRIKIRLLDDFQAEIEKLIKL